MKTIPLTQGKVALVDNEDYEFLLNLGSWYAKRVYGNFYAQRRGKNNKRIWMHRVIVERMYPDFKGEIDHRDCNGLNDQRYNLRIATHSQNMANQRPQKNCTSKYKGVSWHQVTQKWMAYIKYKGTVSYLGLFNDEIKAAKAYDAAAWWLWKDYARLNFLENYL